VNEIGRYSLSNLRDAESANCSGSYISSIFAGTLYAEDEGTLAVVGDKTPDPLAFFYDPRLLSVEAGTSLTSAPPTAEPSATVPRTLTASPGRKLASASALSGRNAAIVRSTWSRRLATATSQ
jgi:hypothetical protein